MIETRKTPEAGETPAQITVSMIDQDLKDGISKPEMATKYGIKPWEVDEMFKHPLLKGRRPSRKKKLSFSFVDDMTTNIVEEVITDPNQVTLEQAIDNAIETVEDAKQEMQKAEEAIVDMLSPTEYETKGDFVEELESLADEAEEKEELPSFEDTLKEVADELKEGDLDMDDDTFEL